MYIYIYNVYIYIYYMYIYMYIYLHMSFCVMFSCDFVLSVSPQCSRWRAGTGTLVHCFAGKSRSACAAHCMVCIYAC